MIHVRSLLPFMNRAMALWLWVVNVFRLSWQVPSGWRMECFSRLRTIPTRPSSTSRSPCSFASGLSPSLLPSSSRLTATQPSAGLSHFLQCKIAFLNANNKYRPIELIIYHTKGLVQLSIKIFNVAIMQKNMWEPASHTCYDPIFINPRDPFMTRNRHSCQTKL